MTGTPPLLAVLGPTASGKSHLAVRLAQRFGGEIINCDSLQMVRYFDIGSAKPTLEERQGVPHHLWDVLNPDEEFSAGEYSRRAREILAVLTARRKLPIVVGGTGFYLRALLDGLFAGPQRNPELRERLQSRAAQKGSAYLHRLLRRRDPASAAVIHPNDTPKIIRALEVCFQVGRPLSELFGEGRQALQGYAVIKVGLNPPRAELHQRIDERTRLMFQRGLVEEVREILARGYPKSAAPFQSFGYREALAYIDGRIDLEEAIRLAQTGTRQYAKRQMTWFRKETGVHWFAGFGTAPAILSQVIPCVAERLASCGSPQTGT